MNSGVKAYHWCRSLLQVSATSAYIIALCREAGPTELSSLAK